MDGHDRHHRHARVGQDLGGLVRLVVNRAQGGGERVAAMQSRTETKLDATVFDRRVRLW
jgi:hypothetical protein